MTEPHPATGTAGWPTLIAALAATALATAAGLVMFSAFMYYDDEGYVLMSLRSFAEHGGLYRDVFSQYGPFPYVLHAALHKLGVPFTHAAGRLLTLAAWSGAAILAAALVRHATRSLPATLASLAATFAYLWIMASEPSHPGGLITLITAIMAAAGYWLLARGRVAGWAILTGAAVASLVLTKINVGGLAGLSAAAWMLLHARNPTIRRWAPGLLIAGMVALPLALMRPLLETGWVQTYALIFGLSGISIVLAVRPAGTPQVGRQAVSWGVGTGAAIAALVVGTTLARGTTLAELIHGILIRPLQQPTSFSLRYLWPPGTIVAAFGSLLLCVTCSVFRHRGSRTADRLVAGLRLAAGVGVATAMIQFPALSPDRLLFGYGAPALWLFLWPLPSETPPLVSARAWVGLLLLGQFLHAFPVAGSQIAWGTFLILPLAAIGTIQAAQWFAGRDSSPVPWHLPFAALNVGLVLVTLWLGFGLTQVAARYREGSDLDLRGAGPLRLPSDSVALYRILSLNAEAHGAILFSEPGMFSFNLWSNVRTPTLGNVTHWFSLLNRSEQQRIIDVLEAEPRACVIVQRTHIEFLRQRGFAPAGALHDYIASHFSPVFSLDGFEFCVRNGREVSPLMLGAMRIQRDDVAAPGQANTRLELRALLPPGRTVARIEVLSVPGSSGEALVLDEANARVEATPTDFAGRPVAAPQNLPWPLRLDGPATLHVHFDRHAGPRPIAGALITFRGPEGEEVALARLKQEP